MCSMDVYDFHNNIFIKTRKIQINDYIIGIQHKWPIIIKKLLTKSSRKININAHEN